MIRVVNRLVAFVIGAALMVGGALVVVEAIATWTNSGFVIIDGSGWLSSFKSTPWSASMVIFFSVVAAAVGVLLLLLEVKPQRKRVVPFKVETTGDWVLMRRSTEAHLSRRLSAQVPTSPIKARLKPGLRRWTLDLKARAAVTTAPVLESAGKSELEGLHAPSASRVRVKTTGATKA